MNLIPTLASEWVKSPFKEDKSVIYEGNCIFPVNDRFMPLWNLTPNVLLLLGSYGCFYADQKVITNNASKKIKDIEKGDFVLSYNELSKNQEFKEVVNLFAYDISEDVYSIILKNGEKIVATKCHKFFFGGNWVSLKNIVYLYKKIYGKNLVKNTKLQSLRSIKYWRNKNIQLEREWSNKDNKTSIGWQRLPKNDAKKRRWENSNNKSTQDNLYDISRYGKCSLNSSPQKPYKNGQQGRELRVAKSRRQFQGVICGGEMLHPKRNTSTYGKGYRKRSFRDKGKVQSKGLHKKNVSKGVWFKRKSYKGYSNSQELGLAQIKSVSLIKVKKVYDIQVKDNSNYFLDCKQKVLVHNSGKSVFAVTKLLKHLLNDNYFRLYYGRKVHDTIRASCFDTICDTIEDLGLQSYFNYKRSSNSSMEITTKHNKNFMRTFTIDDPSKAKSIKDPSHIWMEEADQFTDKDFGLLLSRLRTKKVKQTQLILTTNTERMNNNHWIVTQILNNSEKY